MGQILVLGAAGFLGLNAVAALRAAGVTPRCTRRRRTNVMLLRKLAVPMVEADLDDPASLRAAMHGCDVVIHAAGHYPRVSLFRDEALATGRRQIDAALDAAAAAGVRRFVYVSSIATVAPRGGAPSTERDRYAIPPGIGVYHDLKWYMERRVLDEDRLEVAVACPGACIGPLDLKLGTARILAALGWGQDPPHPDGWVNLVDARDVGRALARLALHPTPPRRVLLAAHDRRLHPLMVALARRYGAPRPSAPLSAAVAARIADAEERRSLASSQRPRLVREIVDLVVHGMRIDATLAQQVLGLRWRTLEDTLDTWDAWALRLGFLPPMEPVS